MFVAAESVVGHGFILTVTDIVSQGNSSTDAFSVAKAQPATPGDISRNITTFLLSLWRIGR